MTRPLICAMLLLSALPALHAGPGVVRQRILLPPDAVEPPVRPEPRPRAPLPADAVVAPPARTTKQTVQMEYKGVVGWGYLRLHQPELVVDMLKQVQAGKLSPSTLNGLASPADLTVMLQQRWGNVALPKTQIMQRVKASAAVSGALRSEGDLSGVTQGGPLRVMSGGPGGKTVVADSAVWNYIREHSTLLVNNTPTYFPKQVNYPGVWDGQSARAALCITSTTDGPLTASLPDKSPFRIVEMAAYDGSWLDAFPKRKGGRIVELGGAKRPVLVHLRPAPVRHVTASLTSPPWTMDVKSGQDVAVFVAFEPHFDLFAMPAGIYKDTLQVGGRCGDAAHPTQAPWDIAVPIQGMFQGKALGVLVLADSYNVDIPRPTSYDPTVPGEFEVGITLINTSEAASGTLRATSLPVGITMDSLNVTVGAHATVKQTLHFRIDRGDHPGFWQDPMEVPYPVTVRFDYNGKTSWLGLSVALHVCFHVWETGPKSCGSVDYSAALTVYADDRSSFWAIGYNNDFRQDEVVFFHGGVGLDDSHLQDIDRIVNVKQRVATRSPFSLAYGPILWDDIPKDTSSWHGDPLLGYESLIQGPLTLSVDTQP